MGRRCGRELERTPAEVLPLQVLGPLEAVVHPFLGPGVVEQVRVGLGDLGGRLVTGQEVKVRQPGALAGLVCVSLRGGRQRGRAGQLVGFGGRTGELLPGGAH